jgi:hypothetical protein
MSIIYKIQAAAKDSQPGQSAPTFHAPQKN